MSQKSNDILSKTMLGAIAVALTFGAAQLALGRDLSAIGQEASVTPEMAVNRTAKADRGGIAGSGTQTRTILLRLDGLANTSILLRVPVDKEARNSSPPSVTKSGDRKIAVACEPVVSVLTEIAKQLPPGRCVT